MQRNATPRSVAEIAVVSATDAVANQEELRERDVAPASGEHAEQCPALRAAMCGLKNLGFRERDARRALAVVAAPHPERRVMSTPIETVIREALAVLT